jgi:hypothetical protein
LCGLHPKEVFALSRQLQINVAGASYQLTARRSELGAFRDDEDRHHFLEYWARRYELPIAKTLFIALHCR